jgi:glucokinase
VVAKVGHYLGTALVSLANIFEPEVIVLGGGAMAFGDLLLEPVRREVAGRALSPMNATPVVAATLGPAAGMIGAAALARVELEAAR